MDWYYSENGQQKGPLSEGDLKALISSGKVMANDLIWREGMADWLPVAQVPEFSGSLGVTATPAPTPAAAGMAAPHQTQPGGYAPTQPGYVGIPTSGTAIASLVCGLCTFIACCFSGIPAIICGHIALSQINQANGQIGGKGMAIAGLILGYLSILGTIGLFILGAISEEMDSSF